METSRRKETPKRKETSSNTPKISGQQPEDTQHREKKRKPTEATSPDSKNSTASKTSERKINSSEPDPRSKFVIGLGQSEEKKTETPIEKTETPLDPLIGRAMSWLNSEIMQYPLTSHLLIPTCQSILIDLTQLKKEIKVGSESSPLPESLLTRIVQVAVRRTDTNIFGTLVTPPFNYTFEHLNKLFEESSKIGAITIEEWPSLYTYILRNPGNGNAILEAPDHEIVKFIKVTDSPLSTLISFSTEKSLPLVLEKFIKNGAPINFTMIEAAIRKKMESAAIFTLLQGLVEVNHKPLPKSDCLDNIMKIAIEEVNLTVIFKLMQSPYNYPFEQLQKTFEAQRPEFDEDYSKTTLLTLIASGSDKARLLSYLIGLNIPLELFGADGYGNTPLEAVIANYDTLAAVTVLSQKSTMEDLLRAVEGLLIDEDDVFNVKHKILRILIAAQKDNLKNQEKIILKIATLALEHSLGWVINELIKIFPQQQKYVDDLLTKAAEDKSVNPEGESVISMIAALSTPTTTALQLLLTNPRHMADINCGSKLPLFTALEQNALPNMALLLEKKADPFFQEATKTDDEIFFSAIHFLFQQPTATLEGYRMLFEAALKQKGSDWLIRVMHLALNHRKTPVVAMLLQPPFNMSIEAVKAAYARLVSHQPKLTKISFLNFVAGYLDPKSHILQLLLKPGVSDLSIPTTDIHSSLATLLEQWVGTSDKKSAAAIQTCIDLISAGAVPSCEGAPYALAVINKKLKSVQTPNTCLELRRLLLTIAEWSKQQPNQPMIMEEVFKGLNALGHWGLKHPSIKVSAAVATDPTTLILLKNAFDILRKQEPDYAPHNLLTFFITHITHPLSPLDKESKELFEQLLKALNNLINTPNNEFRTPLEITAQAHTDSLEVAKLLINHSADPGLLLTEGSSPLLNRSVLALLKGPKKLPDLIAHGHLLLLSLCAQEGDKDGNSLYRTPLYSKNISELDWLSPVVSAATHTKRERELLDIVLVCAFILYVKIATLQEKETDTLATQLVIIRLKIQLANFLAVIAYLQSDPKKMVEYIQLSRELYTQTLEQFNELPASITTAYRALERRINLPPQWRSLGEYTLRSALRDPIPQNDYIKLLICVAGLYGQPQERNRFYGWLAEQGAQAVFKRCYEQLSLEDPAHIMGSVASVAEMSPVFSNPLIHTLISKYTFFGISDDKGDPASETDRLLDSKPSEPPHLQTSVDELFDLINPWLTASHHPSEKTYFPVFTDGCHISSLSASFFIRSFIPSARVISPIHLEFLEKFLTSGLSTPHEFNKILYQIATSPTRKYTLNTSPVRPSTKKSYQEFLTPSVTTQIDTLVKKVVYHLSCNALFASKETVIADSLRLCLQRQSAEVLAHFNPRHLVSNLTSALQELNKTTSHYSEKILKGITKEMIENYVEKIIPIREQLLAALPKAWADPPKIETLVENLISLLPFKNPAIKVFITATITDGLQHSLQGQPPDVLEAFSPLTLKIKLTESIKALGKKANRQLIIATITQTIENYMDELQQTLKNKKLLPDKEEVPILGAGDTKLLGIMTDSFTYYSRFVSRYHFLQLQGAALEGLFTTSAKIYYAQQKRGEIPTPIIYRLSAKEVGTQFTKEFKGAESSFNTVENLPEKTSSSSITVPSFFSKPDDKSKKHQRRKIAEMALTGDPIWHAVWGIKDEKNGKIQCPDIKSKRNKLATVLYDLAAARCAGRSHALLPHAIHTLKGLVVSDDAYMPAMIIVRDAFNKYKKENKLVITQAYEKLQSALKKYPHILRHIEANCSYTDETFAQKLETALQQNGGLLYAVLTAEPELRSLLDACYAGFNWEEQLATPEILNGYAGFINSVGVQPLSLHEAILATHVFPPPPVLLYLNPRDQTPVSLCPPDSKESPTVQPILLQCTAGRISRVDDTAKVSPIPLKAETTDSRFASSASVSVMEPSDLESLRYSH